MVNLSSACDCILTCGVSCHVHVCVCAGRGDQACFLWEGNDLGQDRVMTYKQVLEETCQLVSENVMVGALGTLESDSMKRSSRAA